MNQTCAKNTKSVERNVLNAKGFEHGSTWTVYLMFHGIYTCHALYIMEPTSAPRQSRQPTWPPWQRRLHGRRSLHPSPFAPPACCAAR